MYCDDFRLGAVYEDCVSVYVDLKYDDVVVIWLIVVCECVGWLVCDGQLCCLCLVLLRFVWVCECCISSQESPARSLFRHRHVSQGLSYLDTLAGSSFKLTLPNRDLSLDLLCHSLHRTTFAGK